MKLEDSIRCKDFIENYFRVELSSINLHTFFNNLAMFVKISSGTYSFEKRNHHNNGTQKYETGRRYEYLENLSKLEEFKHLSKYTSKLLKGELLTKLMEKERKDCIAKNRDSIKFYEEIV